jgi:hypothetical protein
VGDHALVDETGELDFVAADAIYPDASFLETLHGRLDDLLIHFVKVDLVLSRQVLLDAKRHDDETGANVLVGTH